jgi:tRNA dimethylallyltransferase
MDEPDDLPAAQPMNATSTFTLPPAPLGGWRWVGLAGPTASGKTGLALALAQQLPLEIISVDSALVYRGMDIGTAKPSPAELASVPHHLIDVLDPLEAYSAAQFVRDAEALITQIRARGRLPLLVGGTMLYFKALMDGLDAMPAADPQVRAMLDAQAAQIGWPGMHAKLAEVDPVTAQRLAPGDTQRIQRALEVWHLSGQPLSALHTRSQNSAKAEGAPPPQLLLSLEPADRAWLHQRIHQRFENMLNTGLLEEVQTLRARGDLHLDLPSMRCVGYRQAWEALDAGLSGAALRAQVLERGATATRQLAKRQLTWLRGMQRTPLRLCDSQNLASVLASLKCLA